MIRKTIVMLLLIMFLFTACAQKTTKKLGDKTTTLQSEEITVKEDNKDLTIKKASTDDMKETDIIEITEKMFLTQINDMYYNFGEYEGKTIKVQGMYDLGESYLDGSLLHMVYRNGPGCCGNDGWGGFYLNYDGDYPEKNEWIEVTGIAQMVETDGYSLLYLNVSDLTVMEERGTEFVEQ